MMGSVDLQLYAAADDLVVFGDVERMTVDAFKVCEQLREHHADLAGDALFLHALHLALAQIDTDILALPPQRFRLLDVMQGIEHLHAHRMHGRNRIAFFIVQTCLQPVFAVILHLHRIIADAFDVGDLMVVCSAPR